MVKFRSYQKRLKNGSIQNHRLYWIWNHMINRCLSKSNPAYEYYGGRGIEVCDRWMTFQNFVDDMYFSFKEGLSLDRINNDGNYSPSNCKWSTREQQANNTRRNRHATYEGVTKTISQWARYFNIKSSTFRQRYYVLGWDIDKCINYSRKVG